MYSSKSVLLSEIKKSLENKTILLDLDYLRTMVKQLDFLVKKTDLGDSKSKTLLSKIPRSFFSKENFSERELSQISSDLLDLTSYLLARDKHVSKPPTVFLPHDDSEDTGQFIQEDLLRIPNNMSLSAKEDDSIQMTIHQEQSKYPKKGGKTAVFIIHGRDSEMKESVARLLEQQGLEPIILHEQPDENLTLIEKLEKHIHNCSYAIALLSPEDIGAYYGSETKAYKRRARQNIIFELGWLIGLLGRKKVLILFRAADDFEFPSDLLGVLYKDYNLPIWKYEVIKELKNAGFTVSLDKIKG